VICLNSRGKFTSMHEISRGTIDMTIAYPRDILQPVISHNAPSFIVIHNHPSGEPLPSEADDFFTTQLVKAALLMEVHLVDHMIIGRPLDGRSPYYSYAQAREDLAIVLDDIALLLELKGENHFKTRAYRNGAEIVRSHEDDMLERAKNGDLKGIKGIGDALQQKLHELASTGKLEFYEKLRSEFPSTLFELFDLQGLGPKKIKALYDTLSIDSIATLKAAAQNGSIAELSGFGKKTAEKILSAIEQKEAFSDRFRLGDVSPIVESTLDILRDHPATNRAATAGSYRRGKETLHDLDFLVATKEPKTLTDFFVTLPDVIDVIAHGETKASVRLKNGIQCDLRAVSNAEFPFALQYFSGSKEHNVALRSLALKQKLSLNEYGLTPVDGSDIDDPTPKIHDEAQIYSSLGLDYIEPELRENRGEIEAAANGSLPQLVELENLRGTFHNHTTASDGKNTLEEMVDAAADHGLTYLGIADHSQSSFQANGLSEERLLEQIDKIKKLNSSRDDIHVFSGSEVDILKDGSLDFSDDLLAQLDYCVASIHNAMTLSEDDMTARIIRAMENEHVTMLGHLTGRLLLKREAYAVNVDKIIDCAAATGTIIELNANPWRLDMDWRYWKKTAAKGVKTSINPDAHHIDHFQFLHYGIRQARKGWLTKNDVINCLTLDEMKTFFSRKS